MRDIIWTIIIVWAIWKIVDALKPRRVVANQKNEYNPQYKAKPEGTVTVDVPNNQQKSKPSSTTDGEYVDFEEVK